MRQQPCISEIFDEVTNLKDAHRNLVLLFGRWGCSTSFLHRTVLAHMVQRAQESCQVSKVRNNRVYTGNFKQFIVIESENTA